MRGAYSAISSNRAEGVHLEFRQKGSVFGPNGVHTFRGVVYDAFVT
jgi:hypothetical protein